MFHQEQYYFPFQFQFHAMVKSGGMNWRKRDAVDELNWLQAARPIQDGLTDVRNQKYCSLSTQPKNELNTQYLIQQKEIT